MGSERRGEAFVTGLWGVRYQVKDVQRSVAFYTERLGFARIRAGFNRESQADSQWTRRVRLQADA